MPVKAFDEESSTDGHCFRRLFDCRLEGHPSVGHVADAGSDSSFIDPFTDETTLLNITCDVIEPSDGKGYDRDPRSIAKRGEAYLKSTGLGDTAYFGPEPEFFIFDRSSGTWTCPAAASRSIPKKRHGLQAKNSKAATRAIVRPVKGGYFPVPPVDYTAGHSFGNVPDSRSSMGVVVEVHHHEVATPARTKSAPSSLRSFSAPTGC